MILKSINQLLLFCLSFPMKWLEDYVLLKGGIIHYALLCIMICEGYSYCYIFKSTYASVKSSA